MNPFLAFDNALGFRAIRIHYSADPEKNPLSDDPAQAARAEAWLDAQRRAYPDPNDFAREMEINWSAGYGARVFPQFTDTHHAVGQTLRKHKRLVRGWDFGWHAPVCLIGQIDGQERLALLKEIVGANKRRTILLLTCCAVVLSGFRIIRRASMTIATRRAATQEHGV